MRRVGTKSAALGFASTTTASATSAAPAASQGNDLLGDFELTGILSQPRGIPELEATFEIDGNGILKVTPVEMLNKLAP